MINRDNYEEFFLLYADNELSSANRKLVEIFVSQHPDLEEEFSMIRESHLTADHEIVFENKDLLLRKIFENAIINDSNYEEYFLLYTDNELDKAARKDVEAFAARNPARLESLQLFQQTKLTLDTEIQFKGKETLYRSEKEPRLILLPWLRIAAAAMVLLLAGYFVSHFRRPARADMAHSAPGNNGKTRTALDASADQNKKEAPVVTSGTPAPLNQLAGGKKKTENILFRPDQRQEEKRRENSNRESFPVQTDELATGNNLQLKPARLDNKEIVTLADQKNEPLGDKPLANTLPNLVAANMLPPAFAAASEQAGINYVAEAIEKENSAPSGEDIFVANISPKKNKLRGIIRRVSRVFDKSANTDGENKHGVSIGVFRSL